MTPPRSTSTTTDPLPQRFPRPIPLPSPLTVADKQRYRNSSNDDKDKTDGDADFFAELLTARRSGVGGRGVCVVCSGGGKEGEDGAGEDIGIAVSLVDYEGKGEVDGRLAGEPGGRHVEEDGALIICRVEGSEGGSGRGVEGRGVDVVDLDCVVCGVVEEGGVPCHCRRIVLASCFYRARTFERRVPPTLIADVWVYFLCIVRLAERIGDVCETV